MFWDHFSLYCASQESAHGAKMCLCRGNDRDKCPWSRYNCTRKPDPTVSLIYNEVHISLPWNLGQEVRVYLPLPWGWWQADQHQEQAMVHGSEPCSPPPVGLGSLLAPCWQSQRPPWSPSAEPRHASSEVILLLLISVCVTAMCFIAWERDNKKKICSNK